MTTQTTIVVNDEVRVKVVPHYFLLKRKHGQLLKDFGLLKHQRKAVYDLIHTFMHANSHQNSLRDVAPTEPGTHKGELRKSQSLGSLNTIEQKPLVFSPPLANTDSESDEDTPTPAHPSPDHSTQSHESGAVVVSIRTNTSNQSILKCEERIKNLEEELNRKKLERPFKSALIDRMNVSNKTRLGRQLVNSVHTIESATNAKEKYEKELEQNRLEQKEITDEIIECKRKISCLRDGTSTLKEESAPVVHPKDDDISNLRITYSSEKPTDRWKTSPEEEKRIEEYNNKYKSKVSEDKERRFRAIVFKVMKDPYLYNTHCSDNRTLVVRFAESITKYPILSEFITKCAPQENATWNHVLNLYLKERKFEHDLYDRGPEYLFKWYVEFLERKRKIKQMQLNKQRVQPK